MQIALCQTLVDSKAIPQQWHELEIQMSSCDS
jgi:hypothetical protein